MNLARHWRLGLVVLGAGAASFSLLAVGAYGPAAMLAAATAVSLPCLLGRVVWPALVTGRLTQLTRRCWDEWQRRDWDAMVPRMAPDIVMEDVAEGRSYRGPAAVRARLERFVEAFPNGQIAVLDIAESADRTTSQLAFVGTNTGPFEGRPPTHRAVTLRFCEVFTFRGDRISRVEEYYDREAMLRQLGLGLGRAGVADVAGAKDGPGVAEPREPEEDARSGRRRDRSSAGPDPTRALPEAPVASRAGGSATGSDRARSSTRRRPPDPRRSSRTAPGGSRRRPAGRRR